MHSTPRITNGLNLVGTKPKLNLNQLPNTQISSPTNIMTPPNNDGGVL